MKKNCRYCQRQMPDALIDRRYNIYIAQCQFCDSEESFYENGDTREWSFMVGRNYCIHYWPESKALKIVLYNAHGRPQKYVLEVTLMKDPDYMTPTTMTEERIKTLILFS